MGKMILRSIFGLSLILLPLAMFGQSGTDMSQSGSAASQSGSMGQTGAMGQSGSSMGNSQSVTATGCLQKGQENGGYYLTDDSGKTWELAGNGLSAHVGHKITVTGHEMQGSKAQEAKIESSEKAEAGMNKSGDLKVTDVKMVSETCQ
jgi:hypothetical protein